MAFLISIRKEHGIFLRKLIQWLGLLRNMPCSFFVIWVERNATKATTRNGVPQGKERPQHTPSQTDTVVRFVQEHVAVFCVFVI